jgi:hypothetical protein
MRAYRLLLHLYPSSFRNEYGEEMRAVFERRRRDVTGVFGVVAVTLIGAYLFFETDYGREVLRKQICAIRAEH